MYYYLYKKDRFGLYVGSELALLINVSYIRRPETSLGNIYVCLSIQILSQHLDNLAGQNLMELR